jgi:hypothetical protein
MTPDMSRRSDLIRHASAVVRGMMRRNVRVYTSLTELLAGVQVGLLQ